MQTLLGPQYTMMDENEAPLQHRLAVASTANSSTNLAAATTAAAALLFASAIIQAPPVATRTTRTTTNYNHNHNHNYYSNCKSNQRHNQQSSSSMNHLRRTSLQVLLFIFALLFVSHNGCATATPAPSISSSESKQQQDLAETGTASSTSADTANKPIVQQQLQSQDDSSAAGMSSAWSPSENNINVSGKQPALVTSKTNTAEKLKRGLTNFMNQLNPAPFFVPTSQPQSSQSKQQQQQLQHADGNNKGGQPNASSAEPATIVNSDSSLVIKGAANRWAFARPIGGPLRWGRR